ncbi:MULTISPECIES: helicase-related protein [Pseudonocardia]|uniref:RNA polymerase-associated protein RapA n=2 Tax=Pseudonocardia TaxID=1847 RepID=A0A1Y2MIA2_PSEAH|nr:MULTISPECIES: helicase-related protein [Pseudonocardia]OSY34983.1 RNA polymerase-associated protein RapA [Pseudonocardia autotrophica]TDN73189.1 SNF2 domain-containing protein [Pseudonocardia autotrophica]BBG03919.1 RNA helicase [Pseudonocardia autotrophica]GEC28303.1 RNA helicase [Pseudonocardia saturnea]
MRAEDLTAGVTVHGLRPGPVSVLAAIPHGPDTINLVFQDSSGVPNTQLLYPADLARLTVEQPGSRWSFDADGAEFRLAAEALRIRMAGLHDPMLAVSSSDVRPLPHQIRAVYGELLPKTPLRFLLADDPGAGKTIMAGLYAKELMLRGDLARMLIVAPGSLVEQWQDELAAKFGIDAEILSPDMAASAADGNPFTRHPLLIARMDQLARSEPLRAHLATSEWDLVVVDEAHRMSARWWTGELRTTKRYELGQELGNVARHLLLMTATPHAGSEENYQLFLALLDPDRFEGRFRDGVHSTDTTGLMRRMVKEDLLTFEGRPLFPERIAETVPYELSGGEQLLYERVTQYVREEMNRAESLDAGRVRTVGFALTVLQRRLASSTHAILRSLERRRHRLQVKRQEMLSATQASSRDEQLSYRVRITEIEDFESDELDAEQAEALEENVVDAATAAQSAVELAYEISQLDELVALATDVRDSGQDRKWAELRRLLLDEDILRAPDGTPRKLIVFTEHKDTLNYLAEQIRNVLGRDDGVLVIHGGTKRDDRRRAREEFTHDPARAVLVATDAAGEGMNLQAAHLMINYDLPWNPNRLEQRFGRIHRIGQESVCRLWNLVAEDTREGQVFTRLLTKMEEQRRAYGGRLFDVLGDAFTETSLRDLLMKAIRYGDDPERRAEMFDVVDAEVSSGLNELLIERALAQEALSPHELEQLRKEMDEAAARRLQPHYVELFFRDAFTRLGGRISRREVGRHQISNVPATLRARQRPGSRTPLTTRYERVTFEPSRVEGFGRRAELLAPGHPLMDTVLDATVEAHRSALDRGAVLFDPHDFGTVPQLVVALTGEIVDGTGRVVSKRFAFVTLTPDGRASTAGPAPYLDAEPLPARAQAAAKKVLTQAWLNDGVETLASTWAVTDQQPEHLEQVRARMLPLLEKTTAAVRQRLLQQVNWHHSEAARIRDEIAAGKGGKIRQSPDRLESRARELEARLDVRTAALIAEAQLAAKAPTVVGAALIIPAGLVSTHDGRHPADTTISERRAVDAVLAAERALGRDAEEMPHNNPGYDIRSTAPGQPTVFIEVKGRVAGADDFFVTYNEVLFGKNAGDNHRLALVSVSPDGPEHDELRYLANPFRSTDLGGFTATGIRGDWDAMWNQGGLPQ